MDNTKGGWVMVTKLSIAIAVGMGIGSGMAPPDLQTFYGRTGIRDQDRF